jgi:hypothetical protein
VKVLKEWSGPLPSEFGICEPEDDLAVMVEYTIESDKMRAYEEKKQVDKIDNSNLG